MDVELRHLRYFVAVAEEMSFTRAAERLHMAQPPLSTQVRALERALGVELFDRSRRAIALTDAGEVLLGEARRLLVQVEQGLAAATRAGTGEVGRLTVGFVPSASVATLPGHLRAFRARYPGVELFLREMAPDELVAGLHGGGVDVCFLYLPFADERLATRTVAREPLVAALPAEHRLAGERGAAGRGGAAGERGAAGRGGAAGERGAPLRVRELRDEPFVLPARHHVPGLNAGVLETCRRAGFEPHAVQKDVWLMQTVLGLVAAGLGVALVPASVEKLGRSGVVFRSLRDPGPPVEMGAFWRADDRSATLRNFVSVLEAV
jgi:DNA-binding transcriptional LysR family regulator